MTCAANDLDKRKGNHIEYAVNKDRNENVLEIEMAVGDLCRPKPEQCHCKTLLQRVLELNLQVDRIDIRIDADPFMAGCKCYLGVAARAGFKLVEDCETTGRMEFTTNDYGKVCETLQKVWTGGMAKIYKI